ncbi:hypothetical protein Pint_31015 [Pistacia integerrima]|uniref:Uncharacterized protein n=1 Tax=Pistacia integerrima TaxID=434235 RepID=A0ACC0XP73_9ROSI|nr:hypothetical protein Pint_31015 [Pistacia integerrima]
MPLKASHSSHGTTSCIDKFIKGSCADEMIFFYAKELGRMFLTPNFLIELVGVELQTETGYLNGWDEGQNGEEKKRVINFDLVLRLFASTRIHHLSPHGLGMETNEDALTKVH